MNLKYLTSFALLLTACSHPIKNVQTQSEEPQVEIPSQKSLVFRFNATAPARIWVLNKSIENGFVQGEKNKIFILECLKSDAKDSSSNYISEVTSKISTNGKRIAQMYKFSEPGACQKVAQSIKNLNEGERIYIAVRGGQAISIDKSNGSF